MAGHVEEISAKGRLIALVVRAELEPSVTTFLTGDDLSQQVGLIVRAAGDTIARHVHRPLERRIVGTAEVLVVRRGRCEVEFYDQDRELVATRELRRGDVTLLVGGGHGFRILEDAVLLEVKQGPYTGIDEKELF
jgi:uncharacterized protein with PhoU and TrkA domain